MGLERRENGYNSLGEDLSRGIYEIDGDDDIVRLGIYIRFKILLEMRKLIRHELFECD